MIRRILFVLFVSLFSQVHALPLKKMTLWVPDGKGSWLGQTESSDWKWGVLPMSEEVADELAALNPKDKYSCMVKSAETVGYSPSYLAGIYAIESCTVK